ncbi:MAG: amino acid permease, partial [Chlamydiia bacterium]|nr:amino acid permease [Chlamydiia bacterium]
RKEVQAKSYVLITAMLLDVVVLTAFVWVKASVDITVILVSLAIMVLIFLGERLFLHNMKGAE